MAEWRESLGLAGLLIVVEKYLLMQDSMVNPLQLQFNILHIIYVRWPRRLKNTGCHLIKIPDCIHHYNMRVLPRFYIQISSKFWLASVIWGAQAETLTRWWSFWGLGKLPAAVGIRFDWGRAALYLGRWLCFVLGGIIRSLCLRQATLPCYSL